MGEFRLRKLTQSMVQGDFYAVIGPKPGSSAESVGAKIRRSVISWAENGPARNLGRGVILISTFARRAGHGVCPPVEAARLVDAKNAPTKSLEKPQKTRLFHSYHRPS